MKKEEICFNLEHIHISYRMLFICHVPPPTQSVSLNNSVHLTFTHQRDGVLTSTPAVKHQAVAPSASIDVRCCAGSPALLHQSPSKQKPETDRKV